MTLAITIEELPRIIQLAHASKNNVLVVGDPGVGKSQVIGGMASETCRVVSMTGSSTIEEYINGIPQVAVREGSRKIKQLEYIPSKWLADMVLYARDNPTHTQILFIDEFNTADPQVLKTFLTILTERRIPTCDIELPKNVVIVAAMNPQDQNEGEPLIRPLASRFLVVQVRSSIAQYSKFISGKPNSLLHTDMKLLDKAEPLDIEKMCEMVRSVSSDDWSKFDYGSYHEINPRSFDNFFRALSWCEDKKTCAPLISKAALGINIDYPGDTKDGRTAGGDKGFSVNYLTKSEVATLEDKALKDYFVALAKDPSESLNAMRARMLVRTEMLKRGIGIATIEVLGGEDDAKKQ